MPRPAPAASEYRASLPAIWSALIAVYLIWGSTYLAIRYAVETAPPFLMAAVRFIVSGGFLYALRRFSGDPRPQAVEWRSAAIIGVFLLVGGNGGVVWAEQFVTSSLAALLVAPMDGAHRCLSSHRSSAGLHRGYRHTHRIRRCRLADWLGRQRRRREKPSGRGSVGSRFPRMDNGIALREERAASCVTLTRHGDGNACRRPGLDAFSPGLRRMERLPACGCFSTVGTRCRLPDRNRFHRFCRLRLAFARRPHAIGGNLCLRQSAGCGFARLLLGPGADDTAYFARRHAHHRLGRAGKHSAETMNGEILAVALVALLCWC